jgi:hypothetical protein
MMQRTSSNEVRLIATKWFLEGNLKGYSVTWEIEVSATRVAGIIERLERGYHRDAGTGCLVQYSGFKVSTAVKRALT